MVPASVRCWAEIELDALRHNASVARELSGRDTRVLAVVKADAYGLGAVAVSRHLVAHGEVRDFGVANVTEAQVLREALPPDISIELLSPALPAEWPAAARLNLTPWLSNVDEARGYARAAAESGRTAPIAVVVEVDTGMGRTGVLPAGLAGLLDAIAKLPALRLAGVATHLPSSDEDFAFTTAELAQFAGIHRALPPASGEFRTQARNSAGVLGYPSSDGEMVRAGLMLYGVSPLPARQELLRPVLSWKTRVTLVRELPAGHGISYGRTFITPRPMRVATLAAGYADGYMRSVAGAGASILVRGRRCALLGRVTMDQMMVDVSDLPEVSVGDEAVLIGRQGNEEVSAAEVARRAGTIAWEVFTGLSPRVTRVYW